MKINNVEFELNLSDPKVLEDLRIETEVFNRMIYKINQMSISINEKVIRKKVLLGVFFERVFGEGSDKKIFNDCLSISECENIMKQFNREVRKQYSDLKGIVIKFPFN